MKKYISVNKEGMNRLMKVFKVGERCVKNALAYRSDSGTAKAIRFFAVKECGGCTYAVGEEDNLFYDSDGCMRQVYRSGVEIYLDKQGGSATVYDRRGNAVRRYEDVTLSMIPEIQNYASSLKK